MTDSRPEQPDLAFSAEVFHWRGPSPYFFVAVPDAESAHLSDVARLVTYGWGMVPVRVVLGDTVWETSLFPKDGGYLVPLKDAVRRAEQVEDGDTVTLGLTVASRR